MVDWDKLLEYSTTQVAKIRDFRLGLIHYLFLLGVVVYIIGWSFLYKQNYVLRESPVGSVRLRLMEPPTRTPAQKLPYCNQSSPYFPNTTFLNYPCIYWDAEFDVFPPVEDHDMLMTTRVTITNETVDNCSLLQYDCKFRAESPNETYFIADIENFTLMLDHTFVAPHSGIQKNAAQLEGVLFDQNGKEMHPPPPNQIGIKNEFDIMQLGVLLQAAGLTSLDTKSDVSNDTRRFDGIVLILTITYTNLWTYDLNNIRYEFRVTLVRNTKFRAEQIIQTKSIQSRQSWVRYGIRLIVLQVGTIGTFDIQQTLVTIVSGMGLSAAATLVVDFLATKLLPQRKRYQKCIYETTDRLDRNEDVEESRNTNIKNETIQNKVPHETTPLLSGTVSQ